MKSTTTAAAVLALLLAAGLAGAAPPPRGQGRLDLQRATRFLDLDEAQRAAAADLVAQLRTDLAPLRQRGRALHERLRQEIEAGAEHDVLGGTVLEIHANRERVRAALRGFEQRFAALLDGEQRELWEAARQLRRQQRAARRGRAGGGRGE